MAETLTSQGYAAVDVDAQTDIAGSVNIHTGQREIVPSPRPADWRPNHRWLWDRSELESYLKNRDGDIFLCGIADNQTEFYSYFDKVFALVLDDETLIHRLKTRTNNAYGKHPHETAEALELNRNFTEKAVQLGAIVIDATEPADQVAREILNHINEGQ